MVKLDKVKWGFIGCGEVTEKKSGPAFALIEGSEVVAVMSRDKEKAQSYAKRHNIPRWYSDPQQLIGDEDVNAIYIATPPSSHATFAIMSMKAGKPVYIEKPMAASYEVTEKKSGPAFALIEGSEVVAVMSRDKEKAQSYAKRHNIPRWYSDPQQLIGDEDVNAIYIATPPSSHATFAIMSMKAGKPVYIEKPMAASYEDCARINRISQETGIPCFVAYYRRYLPYFQKVRQMVEDGEIGNVINIQIRFAQPPRALDYNSTNLPWRVQPDIAGGGYFYDLAPHQLDLLQDMFGCILEAQGYKSNRGGLYPAEDTISACFKFDSGLPGSGSWCFVAHESAKEDRIEIIGDKGMICFSVFTYDPIALHTERGREEFLPENPPHVQLPLIKAVVEHLQGKAVCTCDGISATPTNWVMDRILDKL